VKARRGSAGKVKVEKAESGLADGTSFVTGSDAAKSFRFSLRVPQAIIIRRFSSLPPALPGRLLVVARNFGKSLFVSDDVQSRTPITLWLEECRQEAEVAANAGVCALLP
jgi:hypothetical protein